MLQAAGPNPALETQLVVAGNKRENVRFFLEVIPVPYCTAENITRLLVRTARFTDQGLPANGACVRGGVCGRTDVQLCVFACPCVPVCLCVCVCLCVRARVHCVYVCAYVPFW
jgi:hypothetical protein